MGTEDDLRTDFLDFCFEHTVSIEEFPGIQTLCMKLAYRMCTFYPELMDELKRTIEAMEIDYGKKSKKVFLYVHGLHGQKEEALAFAEVAVPKGYQVMAIDLPVECKPWEVLPLLNEVLDYLYMNWKYT